MRSGAPDFRLGWLRAKPLPSRRAPVKFDWWNRPVADVCRCPEAVVQTRQLVENCDRDMPTARRAAIPAAVAQSHWQAASIAVTCLPGQLVAHEYPQVADCLATC